MSVQITQTLLILTLCCICVSAQTSTSNSAATPANTSDSTVGSITGSVVNESGQPLAGVQVSVRRLNFAGGPRNSSTDSEGTFRVNGLSSGLYVVTAAAPGYVQAASDPGQTATHYRIGDNVRLELIRGGVITGSVTNAAGEPLIAITVQAWMVRDTKGRTAKIPYTFYMQQATDDRGIYRLFGLMPGTYVVSTGGNGFAQGYQFNPYAADTPTYAPSSTRDGAAEISVRAGEESTADIRYRGEQGHAVSGSVKLTAATGASVTLSSATGAFMSFGGAFLQAGNRTFEFTGLADGDYVLIAREVVAGSAPLPSELMMSDPLRVTIKGADVSGLELTTRPLASLSGRIVLDATKPPECEGKRSPLFSEMNVTVLRPQKDTDNDLVASYPTTNSASPDEKGSFAIRGLMPGRYIPQPQFYGRYWYVNSMTSAGPPKIDAAANWSMLKAGQKTDVTITLTEGAASIRGKVSAGNGVAIPPSLGIYLVPAEREKSADVLRYFMAPVEADGTFSFNNLPPGRYVVFTQTIDADTNTLAKLRLPEAADMRAKLRRAAEAQKTNLDLKPCQNLTNYSLPVK
ncbi:MAG TPA: carboxypeptidase regulatory-like domain-containing protein [Pyrinomonadaceae bacterium]